MLCDKSRRTIEEISSWISSSKTADLSKRGYGGACFEASAFHAQAERVGRAYVGAASRRRTAQWTPEAGKIGLAYIIIQNFCIS